MDAFGVDTVELGRAFCKEDTEWKDWILPDGTPCKVPCFIKLMEKEEDWFLLIATE